MTRHKEATKDLPFTVLVSEDIEVLAILHNGAGVEIPDSVGALYDTQGALHEVHLRVCEHLQVRDNLLLEVLKDRRPTAQRRSSRFGDFSILHVQRGTTFRIVVSDARLQRRGYFL